MDETTSLAELKERVRRFCEARGWDPFHNPKDLAIGISTEAAELLEHFRFRTTPECEAALADPEERTAIAAELADVLFFALRFAERFGLDVSEALKAKEAVNAKRYPPSTGHGRPTPRDVG